MRYEVKDIVKDIRVALEMNNESDALIEANDIDTLSLNEVAQSKIIDSAKYITLNGSLYLCGTGQNIDDGCSIAVNTKGVGTIILPEDFWRLLTFQLNEWEKPARMIEDSDLDYAVQQSAHKGLCGNAEAPVVAICHYPEGLTLELYSIEGTTPTIKRASYLPMPTIDDGGGVEIPERLYNAVVYYAAHLVALSYTSVEVANILKAHALEDAGIKETVEEQ